MSKFKVIIVGGGPTGLTAGHCLAKAGIDFEILEGRPDLDFPGGTALAIWPQNARVLDQLGLLQETYQLSQRVDTKVNILANGSEFSRNNMPTMIETVFGYEWINMPRPELVNFLRRRLPGGEARIHRDKRVTDVEVHDTGVTVHCADGSSHQGSIVLGADGVHSTVRRVMTKSLGNDHHKNKNPAGNQNIKSTYAALFGAVEPNTDQPQPDLPSHVFYEMHGHDVMLQAMHCKGIVFFTIYGRLPHPTPISPARFSDTEKAAFAARWADYHFAPGLTVSDMLARATWTQLVHLEEGIIDTWHGDRVVLAGDAVHKMTPNLGLGYNMAVQSLVAIVNPLRKLLRGDANPSAAALREKVFAPYQAQRRRNAREATDLSGVGLRFGSWDGWLARVFDRHVMPRINGDVLLLKLKAAGLILEGITLDFAEERMFKDGTKKWKHGRPVAKVIGKS